MAGTIKAGIAVIDINGVKYNVKGNFEYNLGINKRETILGQDGVHGIKEMPQEPYASCTLTDSSDLDLQVLFKLENATFKITKLNGKIVVFTNAFFSGDGTVTTEEDEIVFKVSSYNQGQEI